MSKNEKENDNACVTHGSRGKWIFHNPFWNRVSREFFFAVLQEKDQTGCNMEHKQDKDGRTEKGNDKGMIVELVSIFLKICGTQIQCGITGRMTE